MSTEQDEKTLEEEKETAEVTEPSEEAAPEEDQEAPGEPEEQEPEDDGGKEKKEKRFARKKDKNLEKLEEKVAELEDARMRQLAEFENFRKRSEKEKSQMFEVGAKSVIEKILPVMDNFERGLEAAAQEEKTPFAEGMELVYKQLLTAFDEMGVTPIEAVGADFDPNLHNAVMTVEDDSLESGKVAEELQKGYMYKEAVVRHSMVKVVS